MIIEPAGISDLADILSLQKLAYQSEAERYNDFNIPPMRQTPEEIEDEFQTSTFLKASVDGRIIGSVRAYLEDGTCYIGRLIVHPEFQNQGIGKKLMSMAEELAKDNNCSRVRVISGIGVRQYYYKQGYKKKGYYVEKSTSK